MWPCLCNFRVKSCDPGSTNHPQQSPSRLPNNSVATGCKLFFWMNKRSSSDNWPKPWFRSRPKMSQWESTALANNCCNKSLVRPSLWLATVLFKWADPTTRFCKGHPSGTFKSNLPNIPLRAHCPDCKLSFTAWTNCPLRIKKSSGIATANPDSATPTTLYPKLFKRCKSMGSHSCMAMYDQVPARKDEISMPWRTEPAFHDNPEMRLRNLRAWTMLHCLLCIIETKNFGDFCGMATRIRSGRQHEDLRQGLLFLWNMLFAYRPRFTRAFQPSLVGLPCPRHIHLQRRTTKNHVEQVILVPAPFCSHSHSLWRIHGDNDFFL